MISAVRRTRSNRTMASVPLRAAQAAVCRNATHLRGLHSTRRRRASARTSPYNRPMPASEPTLRNGLGASPAATLAGEGTGKPGEKALEGPQQPTLVIQKFAPGEIQVGKPAKFVVQVRNVGAQSADDVTIRDEIPQGTKLVSTSPNATTEGSRHRVGTRQALARRRPHRRNATHADRAKAKSAAWPRSPIRPRPR